MRSGLNQALGLLADEQRWFSARDGLWPIGEVAFHIAGTEEA